MGLIEPHMPAVKHLGRPRATELRSVLDAILYIARTGCQWRMLPKDFPPFTTVQGYFYGWRDRVNVQPTRPYEYDRGTSRFVGAVRRPIAPSDYPYFLVYFWLNPWEKGLDVKIASRNQRLAEKEPCATLGRIDWVE
jgi:hypothetical protein